MHLGLARMDVAHEGFQAIGGEPHRAAQQHGERGDRHLVRIGRELHAEGAANVGCDDADLVQRQAELRREDLAHLERDLMRVMDGEQGNPGIELRHDGTRLERHAGLPREDEIVLDHDRRVAKCRIDVTDAEGVLEAEIAGRAFMDRGRAHPRRRLDGGDRRQLLPFDLDQLEGVLRERAAVRHHGDHRLALPAGFVARERVLGRRHVPGERREARLPRPADGSEIVGSDDGDHAGRGSGGIERDGIDAGMRVRAAQKRDVGDAGNRDVVGVASLAGGETARLAARQRSAHVSGFRRHRLNPARKW